MHIIILKDLPFLGIGFQKPIKYWHREEVGLIATFKGLNDL